LDGINPMMDVDTPDGAQAADTHAYSFTEITKMLKVLPEPARSVVMTAALSGLRKGEIMGLEWEDFDANAKSLYVRRSLWNGKPNEPKTKYSKAPVPVVKILSDALEAHRQRMGKLAVGPIFQASNGSPLSLDNLSHRVIIPAIEKCAVCRKAKSEHIPESHLFKLDETLRWHGWHGFRRGLATNLNALGVDDKTIQAILRHGNVNITMNIYVKSVAESQVAAMDLVGAEMENSITCNDLATKSTGPVN
jgi:integrase